MTTSGSDREKRRQTPKRVWESEEEETKEKTPSRGSRTQDPRREPNTRTTGFPQDWRSEGCTEKFQKNPDINTNKPSHDPAGSWLSKVRSFIGLPNVYLQKWKQGGETGHKGRAGGGNWEKGTGFTPRARSVSIEKRE
ncbi:hypothetical protein NDU88_007865 [Pleurodeles waltl]|uniref:Uncharacterized protein n=1 Tax=Pleurodeles waltl TaxID=8319 RepID=A0AAV7NXK0_PLEWA|nr:hypothetical protein NDU88_007865 [Pleurodeles waltl]